jgi:hypothetical protein
MVSLLQLVLKIIPNYLQPERNIPWWQGQTQSEIERIKNIFQANGTWNQAGIAELIFYKAEFKPKLIDKFHELKNVISYW